MVNVVVGILFDRQDVCANRAKALSLRPAASDERGPPARSGRNPPAVGDTKTWPSKTATPLAQKLSSSLLRPLMKAVLKVPCSMPCCVTVFTVPLSTRQPNMASRVPPQKSENAGPDEFGKLNDESLAMLFAPAG
jgi:hypothetical protein